MKKQPVKPETTYTKMDIELAKRILCSAVSVEMDISYQHCWNTYIDPDLNEKEIGTLYLECARLIRESLHQSKQAIFSGSIS